MCIRDRQLTFHYSDYWSNAETQLIPHEWQEEIDKLGPDATQEEKDAKVEELLYNFTKDFMQRMKEQGTEPEYVAFGNCLLYTSRAADRFSERICAGNEGYTWGRVA